MHPALRIKYICMNILFFTSIVVDLLDTYDETSQAWVCVCTRVRERIPFISVFLDFSLFCCKLVKLISSNSDIPRGIFQKNEREQWTCKVLLSDRRLSFSNRVGRLSNTYTIRDNYTNMDSFIDKGCMALFFF